MGDHGLDYGDEFTVRTTATAAAAAKITTITTIKTQTHRHTGKTKTGQTG